MPLFSLLRKVLTSWYFIVPFMAGLGIVVGALIFVYSFPGKPKIGIIDIPFTVLTEESSYVIGEYVNYARRDDSIKAVVIRLSSPGGAAASSERLYIETRKLREEKPVVMVMNGIVASGGYMMAMGATHSYAQTSSLVGNVGVIAFSGPLIPALPGEDVIVSGPYKLDGTSRRGWIGAVDQLKSAFAQIVISERGEKLSISEDELVQGRIYSGLEAVKLGLADEIGGDSDAFQKASELAGISNYGKIDVNLEVLREFIQDIERILPSSDDGGNSADSLALFSRGYNGGDPALQAPGGGADSSITRLRAMHELVRYGRLGIDRNDPLPEFPMNISHPNIYYLYVGNAP